MNEEKDPLLQNMMRDSKQFIGDSRFNDILMDKIMRQDKKRFIIRRAMIYSIPLLCIAGLLILFLPKIVWEIDSSTIQLISDSILGFFSSFSDFLRVFVILLILGIVQRLMPVKAKG